MTRTEWLLGSTRRDADILEIGPSYSPIAPKSDGWRTHVVDHAAQEELRAKYIKLGVDPAPIEVVDSVWAGGALHDAVPAAAHGRFSRLIASHVIEHIPDLIGFLGSASRLLAPAGLLALAVPDTRHCFDFFKPLTTTGDVLEANSLHRARHGRRTLWNQHAYSVNWHGVGVWGDVSVPDLDFANAFATAAEAYASYSDDPYSPYVDCHAWQFTPARFQLVMLELGQLGLIDWHVAELEQFGAEFLCTLRAGVEPLDAESLRLQRMQWLYRGLEETRLQIELALGGAKASGFRSSGPQWGATAMLRQP